MMTAQKSARAVGAAGRTTKGREVPMATPTVTDLGAGGVVTAEMFEVEIELGPIPGHEGMAQRGLDDRGERSKTIRLGFPTPDFDVADKVAADWNEYAGKVIGEFSPFRPIVQAYVVTADGSAV